MHTRGKGEPTLTVAGTPRSFSQFQKPARFALLGNRTPRRQNSTPAQSSPRPAILSGVICHKPRERREGLPKKFVGTHRGSSNQCVSDADRFENSNFRSIAKRALHPFEQQRLCSTAAQMKQAGKRAQLVRRMDGKRTASRQRTCSSAPATTLECRLSSQPCCAISTSSWTASSCSLSR
jgi:hypothetical protein